MTRSKVSRADNYNDLSILEISRIWNHIISRRFSKDSRNRVNDRKITENVNVKVQFIKCDNSYLEEMMKALKFHNILIIIMFVWCEMKNFFSFFLLKHWKLSCAFVSNWSIFRAKFLLLRDGHTRKMIRIVNDKCKINIFIYFG